MADNQKHKTDQYLNELETLRQSVQNNKLVLHNVNDLIATHKLNDLSYEYINPATLKVLGYSEEELLGKSAIEFIHPDDIEKVTKTIKEDLEQGEGSAEFRHRKKDGSYIWLGVTAKLIHNGNNNLSIVAISRDITDRKQVEEELRLSELRYRMVVEDQTELISRCKPDTTITFVNKAYCHAFGSMPEELIGKPFLSLIPMQDHQNIQEFLNSYTSEDPIKNYEYLFINQRGETRWLEWSSKAIFNETGSIVEFQGVGRDITDRKELEEALQKKETELRRIIENINDLISKVDNSGVFTYVSPRIYDLLGCTPEEFMGKSVFDFMTDIEAERVGLIFQEIISKQEPYNLIENTLIHKDGFPVVFESSGTPIFDEQEILQGYTNICRDITKRKMAEEALHQKTEELDLFFNLTLDMLCIADTDGYFKKVNSAWERYLGYCSEELLSKPFIELIHPDDITSTLCAISKLESQMEVVDFANRYRHKDGSYRWIEWHSAPSGKLIYAAARDITERKYAEEKLQKAYDDLEMKVQERTAQLNKINEELQNEIMVRKGVEESLRESETYYRTMFENNGTATLIVNKDHKISRINPMFEMVLGYSKTDLEGKGLTSFVIPEYVDLMMVNHRQRELNPASAPQGYEIKGYSKEGEIRDFICGVSVVPESQNSIVSLLDITEQREAEKAIKHTIEFQELLLNISRKFTSIVADDIDEMINTTLQLIGELDDDDRSYVFLISDDKSTMDNTHEWCVKGIKPEIDNLKDLPSDIFPWWMEKLQRFETINIPSVADLPSEAQAEKEILKSQDIQSVLVVPIAYSNNLIGFLGFDSVKKSKIWLEQSATLLALVAEILANALQRRKYIMAIRESEIYYRTIFENTGTAMLLLDKDFKIIMSNSEAEKLTDCTREELISKIPLDWVAPEYIEKVQENIRLRKLDPAKASKEHEIKCIDRQGNLRNVVLNLSMIPNSENLIVSLRDITEQRKVELLNNINEGRFRTLFEQAPVGIEIDRGGTIIDANQEYIQMFGYESISELYGTSIINQVALSNRDETIEKTIRMEQLDELPKLHYNIGLKKDGSTFPVYVEVKNILLSDGSANVGYITDITELKRAESNLRNQIKIQELLLKIFNYFNRIIDGDISAMISTTLEDIGEFNRDDFNFIILFSDDGSMVSNTYEWCAEGIKPAIHHLNELPVDLLPWDMGKTQRFEYVYIPYVKNLRSMTQVENDILQSQSMCSILTVPIVYEEKLIGFLGAGTVKEIKIWTEDTTMLFKLAAQLFSNVFARYKYKTSLKKSEDYYRTVFENTGAATAILEEDLTIFMINEKFERLLGYSKEQVLNKKTYFDLVAYEDQEIVREIYQLRNTQPELAPREYETSIVNIFGDVINVILTADLIPGTTKRAVSIVDITKQKQMLKMLEDRLADLNRLLIRISNI